MLGRPGEIGGDSEPLAPKAKAKAGSKAKAKAKSQATARLLPCLVCVVVFFGNCESSFSCHDVFS